MEQQWSRHSRLSPLKARACGEKKRRPIFAVIRMVHIADRLCAATTALSDPPGDRTAVASAERAERRKTIQSEVVRNTIYTHDQIFWGKTDDWTEFRLTVPAEAREQKVMIEWLLLTADGGEAGFYLDDVEVD